MQHGAAMTIGRWGAFLAALVLFVLASAALGGAHAHGTAHAAAPAPAQAQLDAAAQAPALAANCMAAPHGRHTKAKPGCCSMAGCSVPVASPACGHLLPGCAYRAAAFPLIAGAIPAGFGASPLTPPPRRQA